MPVPPRSAVSFPIRVFVDIPSSDTLDSINALVTDVNKYLSIFSAGLPANIDTVANLTLALVGEGKRGFATNGRKIGEGPGAGTGVYVYYSNGALRVLSTDAPVLA